MKEEIFNKLQDRLNEINTTDLDFNYYLDEDDNANNFIEKLQEAIYSLEIIYYGRAMQYLTDNDTSLNESPSIASEMGYECKDINSELLATLLYQQEQRELLFEIENEISDIFAEIEEEIEEEE